MAATDIKSVFVWDLTFVYHIYISSAVHKKWQFKIRIIQLYSGVHCQTSCSADVDVCYFINFEQVYIKSFQHWSGLNNVFGILSAQQGR